MSTFVTIWKYKVKPEKKTEFGKLYGNEGDWVKLFKIFPGYIKTDLIKDLNNNGTYLTLDYWVSREAYHNFKQKSVNEFSITDKKGEELTLEEKHLGEFIAV
jgi:heme-degrading monooxygenase HmoA